MRQSLGGKKNVTNINDFIIWNIELNIWMVYIWIRYMYIQLDFDGERILKGKHTKWCFHIIHLKLCIYEKIIIKWKHKSINILTHFIDNILIFPCIFFMVLSISHSKCVYVCFYFYMRHTKHQNIQLNSMKETVWEHRRTIGRKVFRHKYFVTFPCSFKYVSKKDICILLCNIHDIPFSKYNVKLYVWI